MPEFTAFNFRFPLVRVGDYPNTDNRTHCRIVFLKRHKSVIYSEFSWSFQNSSSESNSWTVLMSSSSFDSKSRQHGQLSNCWYFSKANFVTHINCKYKTIFTLFSLCTFGLPRNLPAFWHSSSRLFHVEGLWLILQ